MGLIHRLLPAGEFLILQGEGMRLSQEKNYEVCMYLKELEFMIRLAEEQNLTKAAEKLFITPSALTQQISRLEQNMGIPLFHRSRNGWTLTDAGNIYLENAYRMMAIKQDTCKKLQDLSDVKKGTLTVGLPPERSACMFSLIYPRFHALYPHIVLRVIETSVKQQLFMIRKGQLDIGFATLDEQQKNCDTYIPICDEEFLLAAPSTLSPEITDSKGQPYPQISLNSLGEHPFAIISSRSTARDSIDRICKNASFQPNTLIETAHFQTILEIVNQGLCCGIINSHHIDPAYTNISYYTLPSHPCWKLYAVYRKDSYLPESVKTIIRIIRDFY